MFLFFMGFVFASYLFAGEPQYKNYLSYSSSSVEYGRSINEKMYVGVALSPNYARDTSFDVNGGGTYSTYKVEYANSKNSTGLDISIPVKYRLISTRFFSLILKGYPRTSYLKTEVHSTRRYSDIDSSFSTETEDITRRYGVNVLFGFEPSFSPHPRVECFWSTTAGLGYYLIKTSAKNLYGNPSTEAGSGLYYIYPNGIDVFQNLGFRVYF